MNNQDNKEIDINNIFQAIFVFIKKYFKYILIITVLGIIAGYSKSKLSEKYYKTEIITTAGISGNGFIFTSIDFFQELTSDKNFDLISNYFNITSDNAKNIIEIDLDTTLKNQLKFDIYFYNRTDAKIIADGILYYLNHNKYNQDQITELTSRYEKQIAKIDEELADSDSIQKAIIENFDKKNQIVLLNSTLNSDVIQLLEKKIKYSEKLNEIKPIEYIIEAYIPNHAQNSATKVAVIWGLLSFFLSTLVFFSVSIGKSFHT